MLQIPKNVMQIGEVNAHTKIYMEDYVHTFLERRKKAEEYLAFGKKEERGDVLYYLIYGVEKRTDWDRGSYPYFKKYERIGTIEGAADKRIFKPVRGSGILLDGFFVFYEQNEDMQSYMIVVRENEEIAGSEEKEEVMESVRTHREQRKKELQAAEAGQEKPKESGKDFAQKREERAGRERMRIGRTEGNAWRFGRRANRNAGFSIRKKRRKAGGAGAIMPGRPKGHAWTIPDLCRAGSMLLLLVLVAFGLTSVNRYPDMKAVTELFANAVGAVMGEKDEAVTAGASANRNGLIVEERTVEETESVPEAVMDETKEEGELILAQDDSGNIRWMIGTDSGGEETDMQPAELSGTETKENEEIRENEETAAKTEPAGTETVEQSAETEAAALEDDPKTTAQKQETEKAGSAAETPEESMTQAIARPVSYVVKKGDSLAGIARRFYGNASMVWEICDVNQIENPDQIHPGQNILLP